MSESNTVGEGGNRALIRMGVTKETMKFRQTNIAEQFDRAHCEISLNGDLQLAHAQPGRGGQIRDGQ